MATNSNSEDDFTFPASDVSPPHFVESPPLWLRPHEKTGADEEVGDDEENSESCSSQELEKIRNYNEDEAEKMDVLWEDLNDEKIAENRDVSSSSPAQIRCATTSLKLSRANGQMFSTKKPIILVFIKVVKKVLLFQNSHGIKKQAW